MGEALDFWLWGDSTRLLHTKVYYLCLFTLDRSHHYRHCANLTLTHACAVWFVSDYTANLALSVKQPSLGRRYQRLLSVHRPNQHYSLQEDGVFLDTNNSLSILLIFDNIESRRESNDDF